MESLEEQYLQSHRQRHTEELMDFLRIPSISMDPQFNLSLREAATFLEEACSRAGLEHVQQVETTGAPLVYADWLHVPGAPTVLVYGHYDVQPPGLPEHWTSPAFTPEIREGRLYARGASDDKGQLFLHLKAVEAVLHLRGCLAFNVKMLIEGEEEIGSPALQGLLRGQSDAKLRDRKNLSELTVGLHNRVDLQADVVLISDTPFLFADQPALCMGVRGLCGLDVEVLGPTLPLHSGGYGGLVQNPIHALATMLASLYTAEGYVAVPGFYDGLFPLAEVESTVLSQLSPAEGDLASQLGVPALFGEPGYSPLERLWARPTLDVNAFCGGDCQGSVRTLIPRSARATITCRLGVGQDPTRIADALWRHLERITPQGVRLQMARLDEARAWAANPQHPVYAHAARALAVGFRKSPTLIRMGGSIPVVSEFVDALSAPVVLLGFGLPTDNIHAEDEHLSMVQFDGGLRTLLHYYQTELPAKSKLGEINDARTPNA